MVNDIKNMRQIISCYGNEQTDIVLTKYTVLFSFFTVWFLSQWSENGWLVGCIEV